MKNFKRILSLLLVIAMVVAFVPVSHTHAATASDYISSTYASNIRVKASQDLELFQFPTDSSTVVTSVAKGTVLRVQALHTNIYGNYWYKVLYYGQTVYCYASYCAFVEQLTGDVTITSVRTPGSLKLGSAFTLTGNITATYNRLGSVTASIYQGSDTTVKPYMTVSATTTSKTYTIENSTIDNNMKFGSLTAGSYTIQYIATAVSSYIESSAISTSTTAVILQSNQFVVTDSTTANPVTGTGVDVSSDNGSITWATVAENADFANIRIGTGTTADTKFTTNVNACIKNSIPYGVYLTSQATTASAATAEANFVIETLAASSYTPDLPVWISITDTAQAALSASTQLAIIKAFCTTLRAAGYEAGLHSYQTWFEQYYTDTYFNTIPKWVSHIDNFSSDGIDYVGGTWLWQYTLEGTVDGISGSVACSKSYVTLPGQENAIDYINTCTYYPSYADATLTGAVNLRQYPRGEKADSNILTAVSSGSSVLVTGLYLNELGEYWYQVVYGSYVGYMYASYVSPSTMRFDDVAVIDPVMASNLTAGSSYSISGHMVSQYNEIASAYVKVFSNETTSSAVMSDSATISTKSFYMQGSKLDKATSFDELAEGYYTYVISARVKNYYLSDGELTSTAKTVNLFTAPFTVGSSSVTLPESDICVHDEVVDEAVAATCTETGLTEGKHCSKCGLVIKAQTVTDALGHKFSNGSCTRCGLACDHSYESGVCTVCKYECPHSWNGNTCTVCGFTCTHSWKSGVCSNCGYKCSHSWSNGTCSTCGLSCSHTFENSYCTNCGTACSHSWKNGECTACGFTCVHVWKNGVCTVCGTSCSHSFVSGICTTCSVACTHSWADGVCSICKTVCAHSYKNGVCAICGEAEPVVDYYLFGYINGVDYACGDDSDNLGIYKFVDNTLTVTFTEASYVGVKTGDNLIWYMTNGWLGENATSATLFNSENLGDSANKLYVPGNREIIFTLKINTNNTVTLSYVLGACDHSFGTDGICTICGEECTHSWSGGVCADCGKACVHTYSDSVCTECGTACSHLWINGVCYLCKKTCTHSWTTSGTCSVCNTACTHSWSDGVCSTCGTSCVHSWSNGNCTTCGISCTHSFSGGVCSVCGKACTHSWSDGGCAICGMPCTHSWSDGVCATCGFACSHSWSDGCCSICAKVCTHSYSNGVCTVCGTQSNLNYYLFGYINGVNYACEEDAANLGIYQFVDGTLTATFTEDSYVAVRTDNNNWYMTNGWQGTGVTSVTLENTTVTGVQSDKLYVPGNRELTFTLIVHDNDTLTLSYVAAECTHSWSEGVCSSCGQTCTHSWVNHVCENCGMAASIPTLTLKTYTVSFDGEVRYNIYYTGDNLDDVALEDMGMITWSTPQSDGTISTAEAIIPGAVTDGTQYMVHSKGIPAKQLSDSCYFKIYAKMADGTYVYTDLKSVNAKTYANSIFNKSTNEDMKALCVAMLNYGAAAQTYFNYKSYSLMNADLTDEQKAMVSDYDSTMVASAVSVSSTKAGIFTKKGFGTCTITASFEGAFVLNYYLNASYIPDGDVTLYYWTLDDFNAATILTKENATGTMVTLPTGVDKQYWGEVTGIAAKELDQTVFVAAVYTSGGVEYTTSVMNYSMGRYCVKLAADDTSSQQELAKATAVYGYYAKQYFANLAAAES